RANSPQTPLAPASYARAASSSSSKRPRFRVWPSTTTTERHLFLLLSHDTPLYRDVRRSATGDPGGGNDDVPLLLPLLSTPAISAGSESFLDVDVSAPEPRRRRPFIAPSRRRSCRILTGYGS